MKKALCLFIFIVFCCVGKAQTKTSFGLKGGLNLTFFKVNEGHFGTDPEAEVGYYGGVFVDLDFNKNFHFQPELLYIGLSDFKFLNAPLYLKYDIDQNFKILVGPSLNYFFDFFSNKLKIRADLSLAYQFSSVFDAHMKYTLGFEEISPNGLFLGVGIRL